MDLAFTINHLYLNKFKVTAYSCSRYVAEEIRFHVIENNLTESDKEDLETFARKINATINTYHVDESTFGNARPMTNDPTHTTYLKLYIPSILSKYRRVLYLDCDIVVNGDISEFYYAPIKTFLGAVKDEELMNAERTHLERVVSSKKDYYFNAGVILFNFYDGFEKDIPPLESILRYIDENGPNLKYHDQDVFNHLFHNNVSYFDSRFNYFAIYHNLFQLVIPLHLKRGVIIHYAGAKPWSNDYVGFYRRKYLENYWATSKLTTVDPMIEGSFKGKIRNYFLMCHMRNYRLYRHILGR